MKKMFVKSFHQEKKIWKTASGYDQEALNQLVHEKALRQRHDVSRKEKVGKTLGEIAGAGSAIASIILHTILHPFDFPPEIEIEDPRASTSKEK